jgi:hypothetical protein
MMGALGFGLAWIAGADFFRSGFAEPPADDS